MIKATIQKGLRFVGIRTSKFEAGYVRFAYDKYLEELLRGVTAGNVTRTTATNSEPIPGVSRAFTEAFRVRGLLRLDEVRWLNDHAIPESRGTVCQFRAVLANGFPFVGLAAIPKGPDIGGVVVLHGIGSVPEYTFGMHRSDYTNVISRELVNAGFRVVAPFLPHAGSLVQVNRLFLRLAAHGIALHEVLLSMIVRCTELVIPGNPAAQRSEDWSVLGVSMGAYLALHAAIVHDRFGRCVASSYVRDDRRFLLSGGADSHLSGNNIYPTMFDPLATEFDLIGAARLLAPRPLLIDYGARDRGISERYGSQDVVEAVKAVYEQAGASENLAVHSHAGGHQIDAPAAVRWLVDRIDLASSHEHGGR